MKEQPREAGEIDEKSKTNGSCSFILHARRLKKRKREGGLTAGAFPREEIIEYMF